MTWSPDASVKIYSDLYCLGHFFFLFPSQLEPISLSFCLVTFCSLFTQSISDAIMQIVC